MANPLKGKKIVLGITGSIAAYKACYIIRGLIKRGAEVQVVITPAGKEFITPITLSALTSKPVISEFFAQRDGTWNSHVDLGLWADAMLIAPATASTIGKMANGIADNMLITTYLSAKAPVFVAPAMDLDMYAHPSTQKNLETLRSYGNHIIEPGTGELASHLVGKGRMEEPEVGDPRAVKGGLVRLWINTPFPGTLRAFGPGSETFFNYSAIDNVWLPLVGLHPETFRPIPGLADRWAVSADGKTVFYHLDPEATYSDGRPVRAQDFLLNICLRTSGFARDPFWTTLFRSTYDQITVYGDSVIALTLPSPGPLLPYMACVDFHPAHPGFYHDFNSLFLERYQWKVPPNTGGYVVVPGKIRIGERITLARVKDWWAKDRKYYRYSCNADQVEHVFVNLENKAVEMFRRGELDMMNVRKPEVWENRLELPEVHRGYIDKYSLEAGYACPPYGLYLNCADKLLKNPGIRRGLAHSVNMGMVIDTLFRGNMRRLGSYMEGYGDLTLPLKAPDTARKKPWNILPAPATGKWGRTAC